MSVIGEVKIGGVLSHSTVDWSGRVASVVFFSGCQFRCPWCQNPSLVLGEGKDVPIDYVVYKIQENRKLVSSVVLTGGEPTLQSKALIRLCELLRDKGLDIKLDTNGSNPDIISYLVDHDLIQAISIDFKSPIDDFETFCKITGTKKRKYFENFKRTLHLLDTISVPVEYRTTVVPTLNDSDTILTKIVSELDKEDSYILQQFSNENDLLDPKFKSINPQSVEKMMNLGKVAKGYVKNVFVRTMENGEVSI